MLLYIRKKIAVYFWNFKREILENSITMYNGNIVQYTISLEEIVKRTDVGLAKFFKNLIFFYPKYRKSN